MKFPPIGVLPIAVGVVALAASPAVAAAAVGEHDPGPALFAVALLVLVARLCGALAERLGQPSVLGELLAGIGLGNLLPLLLGGAGSGFVRDHPSLALLAQTGVLILLFQVGLEADLRGLLRVGASALRVALLGMLVPFGLGWGAAAWMLPDRPTLVHLFVGATLAATSIGITARVLKDLGQMQSRAAQIILAAAVLDDVLGLVLLAVVSGAVAAASGGGPGLSALDVGGVLLRAALFLGLTVGAGHFLSGPIVRAAARTGQRGMLLIFGLTLCLGLAFAAERIGLAQIIGAFAAGLLLDPYGAGVRTREEERTLDELIKPLAAVFVPLFFVLMGAQVDLATLATPAALLFGGLLVACAIAGKLACAAGVPAAQGDRLAVGIGMVPRGEVGLIFAGIGAHLSLHGEPVFSDATFAAVVLMVLVTTLAAPIGLRIVMRPRRDA